MGQYEPRDSRDVTNRPGHEPGGIERTGPREGEARARADGQPGDKPDEDVVDPNAAPQTRPVGEDRWTKGDADDR